MFPNHLHPSIALLLHGPTHMGYNVPRRCNRHQIHGRENFVMQSGKQASSHQNCNALALMETPAEDRAAGKWSPNHFSNEEKQPVSIPQQMCVCSGVCGGGGVSYFVIACRPAISTGRETEGTIPRGSSAPGGAWGTEGRGAPGELDGHLVTDGPEVAHEAGGETKPVGGLQGQAVDVGQQAAGHGGAQACGGGERRQGVPLQHQGALFCLLRHHLGSKNRMHREDALQGAGLAD